MKYCMHCMSPIEESDRKCPACGKTITGEAPAHHLMPGTVLNKKFMVGAALGEGGFGITYIGRDLNLDLKVAIKEYYPNGFANRSNTVSPDVNGSITEERSNVFDKGRERFLREARILAKFSDEPGIVEVRDFFEENNTAYIVMEYLDGQDLKQYLKAKGRLTPDETITMLTPLMQILSKVHEQGLIHRDISPDNVRLVKNGVKLIDFGASRDVSAVANKSLSMMLKPGYAPEEQYRSKGQQGPWTDIYALCATIYKCITGITPDDATQRMFSDELKWPSKLGINIDPAVEKAIMKGLSVYQKDRYQSIEELVNGLQGKDSEVSEDDKTVYINDKTQSEEDKNTVELDKTVYAEPEPVVKMVSQKQVKLDEVKAIAEDRHSVSGNNSEQDVTMKQKNNILPIVLLGGIFIALIILIILVLGKSDNKDNKETTTTQPTEVTTTQPVQTTTVSPETTTVPPETTTVPPETTTVPPETTTVPPETTTVPPETTTAEAVTMSDNLFDFTVELEGVVYKLPCKYQDLVNNGWTISSTGYSSSSMLYGNSYDYYYMANNGKKIAVYSYNLSGHARSIEECLVGGFECDASVNFKVAKGITPFASADDIVNAFGAPNENSVKSSYTKVVYKNEDNSNTSVQFMCYTEAGMEKYSSITVKNFIGSEKTETNTEIPEYLSDYVAPTELGTDTRAGIISLEGVVYRLPVPVSEFLKNGWKITSRPNYIVSGDSDNITLELNGAKLSVRVENYSYYQTTVENCIVTSMYIYPNNNVAAVLPGGITFGMTKDAVDSILPEDFTFNDYSSSYAYSYSEYKSRNMSVYVSIDKESGVVSTINVSSYTWDYSGSGN